MAASDWTGFHHLSINVHDVARSEQRYGDVLGFTRLSVYATDRFERVVLRHHSGALLGLSRYRAAEADEEFDERNPVPAALEPRHVRSRSRAGVLERLGHLVIM